MYFGCSIFIQWRFIFSTTIEDENVYIHWFLHKCFDWSSNSIFQTFVNKLNSSSTPLLSAELTNILSGEEKCNSGGSIKLRKMWIAWIFHIKLTTFRCHKYHQKHDNNEFRCVWLILDTCCACDFFYWWFIIVVKRICHDEVRTINEALLLMHCPI